MLATATRDTALRAPNRERVSVHTDPPNSELNTWAYTVSLVPSGWRAHIEVILPAPHRQHGAPPELVKAPPQHRGSWGGAAAFPR
jgi:hypothetical protein